MHRNARIATVIAAVLLGFVPSLAVHEAFHCFGEFAANPEGSCSLRIEGMFVHAEGSGFCPRTTEFLGTNETGTPIYSRDPCPPVMPIWLEEVFAYLLQAVVLFIFGHYAWLMSAGRALVVDELAVRVKVKVEPDEE